MKSVRKPHRVWKWWHTHRHGGLTIRRRTRRHWIDDTDDPFYATTVHTVAHCRCGGSHVVQIDVYYGEVTPA